MKKVLTFLTLLMASMLTTSAQAPANIQLNWLTSNPTQWEKVEARIQFTGSYTNPYDYDDVSVQAFITAPNQSVDTVDAFFLQDYTLNAANGQLTLSGSGQFRLRYTPKWNGTYQCVVSVVNKLGNAQFNAASFTVGASGNKGFVRSSAANYLQFDNGQQYIPVGQNIAWQQSNKYLDYQNWTNKLAAQGGNFLRLWQCSWGLGIEWLGNGYDGLKKYRQDNAFYTDLLMEMCAQKGIYIMFCINHHGMVSTTVNPNWAESPYNTRNGGPCAQTIDYFNLPAAKSLHRNRLRYIVARWGYSKQVMSWELFNEVDWTDNFANRKQEVSNWHREMAVYLKQIDPNKHLVTTSFAKDEFEPTTWQIPEIDFTQTHYYNGSANVEAVLVGGLQTYLSTYKKPTYTGEFGLTAEPPQLNRDDPQGVHIHNSVWGTLLGGGLGAGASWWWDNYIEPTNQYTHYKGVSAFAATVPFVAGKYQPATVGISGGVSADLTLSPGAGWGVATAATFTIAASGAIMPGLNQLGTYLYGSQWNTQFRNAPTFVVTFPEATTVKVVTGGAASTSPRIAISVDGVQVLNEAAVIRTTYTVNVPAGTHRILIDNPGTDWIQISQYIFGKIGQPLAAYTLSGFEKQYWAGWLLNKAYNWTQVYGANKPGPVTNCELSIDSLAAGNYQLSWYDCTTGNVTTTTTVQHNGGLFKTAIPTVSWDIAWQLKKADAVVPPRIDAFTGEQVNGKHEIKAVIGSAKQMQQAIVERSIGGQAYTAWQTLSGSGSALEGSYSWMDENIQSATYQYRLKFTATDGQVFYSNIITLTMVVGNGPDAALPAERLKVQPNPASHWLQVQLPPASTNRMLRLLNTNGQVCLEKQITPALTDQLTQLDIQSLLPGLYYLQVIDMKGSNRLTTTIIKR